MPSQMTKRIGAVVGDSVPPYAGMRVVSFLFFHQQVLCHTNKIMGNARYCCDAFDSS
jgi:hypothetical protein